MNTFRFIMKTVKYDTGIYQIIFVPQFGALNLFFKMFLGQLKKVLCYKQEQLCVCERLYGL